MGQSIKIILRIFEELKEFPGTEILLLVVNKLNFYSPYTFSKLTGPRVLRNE